MAMQISRVAGRAFLNNARPVFARQFLWQMLARMLRYMGVEINDTALMLRYRDGDADAFETLYNRHRGPLFRYLFRQIGNQQFAEDVFQEVWSRIIRNHKNYQPTAKFSTYMYHIARNCSIDHFRSDSKRQAQATGQDEALEQAIADTGDPVAAAETRDTRTTLAVALNELPDEQREVFLLHEESGLTLDEIGSATGVRRETVKSRLRYALSKLRKHIPQTELQRVDDG
jgi:RNA polymerase sigma-70 factor (ECF subfamily)